MPVPGGVIFCDDIRREASGKDLVIGIYAGNIITPSLPTVIDNLWTIATVTFSKDEVASEVAIKLVLPGGKELKQPPTKIGPFAPLKAGADYRMLKFRSHFRELKIPEKGRLRLVASIDGKDLRIGGLDVMPVEALAHDDPGQLLSSYFRNAAEGISKHAKTKEELATSFKAWATEIGQVFSPQSPPKKKWAEKEALVIPHEGGLMALFVKPLRREDKLEVSGIPSHIHWTFGDRTKFSALIRLESLPVPLRTVRVAIKDKK